MVENVGWLIRGGLLGFLLGMLTIWLIIQGRRYKPVKWEHLHPIELGVGGFVKKCHYDSKGNRTIDEMDITDLSVVQPEQYPGYVVGATVLRYYAGGTLIKEVDLRKGVKNG